MRIVVTGGAGFIGSCLVGRLNAAGLTDIIVVDSLDESAKWKNLVGKVFEDYMDKASFLELLEDGKLDDLGMVVHFGACTSTTETDAAYLMENNYMYTKRCASWCLGAGVPFLYASSAATYGAGELGYSDSDETTLKLKPLNMYGYSKQLFDVWLVKNRLTSKVTGFKFFNVYGPNEYHKGDMRSLVAKSFETVLNEKKMRLFKSYRPEYADGEQRRDFVYVKDAVEMVYHFIEHPDTKGIYNIGTGNARSWNDLALALFKALDMEPRIEYMEMPDELKDKYQYFTQADLAKLKAAGYTKPLFTLEDAIKDYAEYLKTHSYL